MRFGTFLSLALAPTNSTKSLSMVWESFSIPISPTILQVVARTLSSGSVNLSLKHST